MSDYASKESRVSPPSTGEWLDGRPLIYASLGTVIGNNAQLVDAIAKSCPGLGVQVILSLGGRGGGKHRIFRGGRSLARGQLQA